MNHTRRNVCKLFPALMASWGFAKQNTPLPSRALRFEELPVRMNGGNSFRAILEGTTHGGFPIEVHETDLAPGGMPHPPHRHVQEEMFLIREGTVEITIAGRGSRLGPGSAAFLASNEEHGIRNAGTTHAQYFVIALGSDKA